MKIINKTGSERSFTLELKESELTMLFIAHKMVGHNKIMEQVRVYYPELKHTLGTNADTELSDSIKDLLLEVN